MTPLSISAEPMEFMGKQMAKWIVYWRVASERRVETLNKNVCCRELYYRSSVCFFIQFRVHAGNENNDKENSDGTLQQD